MRRPTFLLAVVILLAATARAEVRVDVEYGFGGQAVAGSLSTIVVTVESHENATLEVAVRARPGARMGGGELCYANDLLSPGAKKVYTFLLRPYSQVEPTVEIEFDRRVLVVDRGQPLPYPNDRVTTGPPRAGAIFGSGSPTAYQVVAAGPRAAVFPDPGEGIRIMPSTEGDLPDYWHAYEGVDALYWRSPGDEGPFEPARITAILRWVAFGGRLVIAVPGRPDLLRNSPLWVALPADLGKPVPRGIVYRDLARDLLRSGLFRRHNFQSLEGVTGPRTPLEPRPGARTVLRYGAEPIAVERPYGLGTVVLAGFDPARLEGVQEELAAAVPLCLFAGELAGKDAKERLAELFPDPRSRGGFLYRMDHDTVEGIMRMLRSDALRAPPMGLLSIFMILYILAVGPLDYWILKKRNLLKYSALTFLGMAVLFSVAAWFVSFYLFAGGERVNRVTFLDVVSGPTAESPDLVRITDFAGFYAPRGDTIPLSLVADTVHFSDLQAPSNYLGGIGGSLPKDPLLLSMQNTAKPTGELRIPFRSLRTTRTVALRETVFPLEVREKEGESGKEIEILNGLDRRIRDAAIVTSAGVQPIGDLIPGEARTIRLEPLRTSSNTDVFSHKMARAFAPDPGRLTEVVAEGPARDLPSAARALMAIGVGSAFDGSRAEPEERLLRARILRKAGIDEGRAVKEGHSLLLGWMEGADLLGLPGAGGSGFDITIVRKVIH